MENAKCKGQTRSMWTLTGPPVCRSFWLCLDTFALPKYVSRRMTLIATVKCLFAMVFGNTSQPWRYVHGSAICPRGPGGWWAQRIWSLVIGR